MAVEVWVRNPELCIRECLEVGMHNLVWDRGYLVKKGIDPDKFANIYFPPSVDYRMLVVGDSDQGAIELTPSSTMNKPAVVHRLWEYGDDFVTLEETLDSAEPGSLVVVTRMPLASTGVGRKFIRLLRDLQEEYSDVTIHLHGLYSWRVMFGLGFKSVDIEPRLTAKKGKVMLPNGKEVTYETAQTMPHWLAAVGFNPPDLAIPRSRCMFNIESARWAAQYFTMNHKFETRHREPRDENKPVRVNNRIQVRNTKANVGDKFLCDLCSLSKYCKYFRVGSVCSVPESEGSELARLFKSRDSDDIIDGLGSLLAIQTKRLEEARADEEIDDKINPEVTKLVNSLFDRGVKLAKLLNPALAAAAAPRVKISLSQHNATIAASNPTALMAAIVNELESRGFDRSEITPEMVRELLMVPEERRQQAIEAAAVERTS